MREKRSTRLDSILVKSLSGKLLKKCILNYVNNCAGEKIEYLKQVIINNDEQYTMQYYNWQDSTKGFPGNGSFSIDHWGYYNGKNKMNSYNIPFLHISSTDQNYNETIITDTRDSDASYAKIGMLEKLTYPTGGYTMFDYESNDYSTVFKRQFENDFKYAPQFSIGQCGGLRIKSIRNFNQLSKLVQEHVYEYKKNGVSSGILLHFPRYYINYYAHAGSYEDIILGYSSSINTFNGSHIEYSEVTEIVNNTNKSTYYYSNSMLQGYCDTTLFVPIQEFFKGIPWQIDNQNISKLVAPTVSLKGDRGRLLKLDYFKNKFDTVPNYSIINHYDANPIKLANISRIIYLIRKFGEIREYVDNYKLISNKVVNNEYGNEVIKGEHYIYNPKGQISKTFSTNSSGDTILLNVIYVTDIPNAENNQVYANMIENNIISLPIIQEKFLKKKSSTTYELISKKRYTYCNPVPTKKELIRLKIIESYNTDKQQFEIELENTKFNEYGYVLEQKGRDGKYTSYLWSYNNKFPIIIANNILYQNLQSIISSDPEIANIQNEIPSDLMIDYLHNKIASSSLSATGTFDSYIYNPNLGLLLQKKSSKGVRQYYQYDNFGRLICVRDNNRNVLERYAYHYQNGSTPESLQIPENNIGAKLTCTLSGNGTLGNNNSLLRVGDAINLGAIFPVTPSQYYEFDGYYVNGVLIPNPGNYIVQGDVQIEARTKEVAGAELIIRFGESLLMETSIDYAIKQNGELISGGRINAANEPSASVMTRSLNYPIQISLITQATVPSLKITIDGIVIFESMGQVPSGHVIEHQFTEFGPHEIVIEIP